jgi:hypothetical protein|tara:strand:- start:470 stop:664 length:195 start_codon:yes stop_codon:yes gene_type:complete
MNYPDGNKRSVTDLITKKGQAHFDRCAKEKRDGEVKPITNFNNLGLAIARVLEAGERAMAKPKK